MWLRAIRRGSSGEGGLPSVATPQKEAAATTTTTTTPGRLCPGTTPLMLGGYEMRHRDTSPLDVEEEEVDSYCDTILMSANSPESDLGGRRSSLVGIPPPPPPQTKEEQPEDDDDVVENIPRRSIGGGTVPLKAMKILGLTQQTIDVSESIDISAKGIRPGISFRIGLESLPLPVLRESFNSGSLASPVAAPYRTFDRPNPSGGFSVDPHGSVATMSLDQSIANLGKHVRKTGLSMEAKASWLGLSFTACSVRGVHHEHNEDRLQVVEDLMDLTDSPSIYNRDTPLITYAAVFDGHGGPLCAQYLSQHLHMCIRAALAKQDLSEGVDMPQALHEGILQCDLDFLRFAETCGDMSGACAVVFLLYGDQLCVANVGDCEASLWKPGDGTLAKMSRAHRTADAAESERILKSELGFIEKNRLCGLLAPSRAFGDLDVKTMYPGVLTCEPYIGIMNVQGKSGSCKAVVLGSDGLWDRTQTSLVKSILQCNKSKKKRIKSAAALVQAAVRQGSTDDITVVVLYLSF
jgi:serine/threonine protein phosphatase PrpC